MWAWVAAAAGAAALGAALAAIYPAWCAMRTDVVEALTLE
jgi:ABC-type lipoprotein release transport system permease subunit